MSDGTSYNDAVKIGQKLAKENANKVFVTEDTVVTTEAPAENTGKGSGLPVKK